MIRNGGIKTIQYSKFGEGFNNNELLSSLSRSFFPMMPLSVLLKQPNKFLLLEKEIKGKNLLQSPVQ